MKKIILFFVALIISAPLFAQDGLHIGIGGIPQNVWILNRNDMDAPLQEFSYKWTWGWAGQFKLGYNFGPPFGIHLNAIYSNQGQDFTSRDSVGATITTKQDINLIKVPMFFHFSSNPGPAMFVFGLGPYMTFLQEVNVSQNGADVYPGLEEEELYRPKTFGIIGYIGADFQLVEDLIYFNARLQCDHSLVDIENKELLINGQDFFDPNRKKAQDLTFGLNLGITFCILPGRGGGNAGRLWIR